MRPRNLKRLRVLVLLPLLATLSGCVSKEQFSELINQAVPLKETAFIPFPVLVGPMDPVWMVIRVIFVPLAFAATVWGLLQWQRHGQDLGRFIDVVGKGFVFMTLFGAPAVALIGFHDIAYGLWFDWINFGFVKDALHWAIPCIETSCNPQDLARGAIEAIRDPVGTAGGAVGGFASLKVAYLFVQLVPVWHWITEGVLLLTFPFALGLSLVSRSFKPLIVWLFAYFCYALFPILWVGGITWAGSNVGEGLDSVVTANLKFIGVTVALEVAIWVAPWIAAGMLLFTGRVEERSGEAHVQISPETLEFLTAAGLGYLLARQGGDQTAANPNGWDGRSGPTVWPAGPPDWPQLPPPSDGGPKTSPDSVPTGEDLEGPTGTASGDVKGRFTDSHSLAGHQGIESRPDGKSTRGPASMTLDAGSVVLGGVAGVAAATVTGLPPSAPLVAEEVKEAAKSGPLGTLAEKLDEWAAEAGVVVAPDEGRGELPESQELPAMVESPLEQPTSEAVEEQSPSSQPRERPFDRGNTSQRATFYARDDLIVDGRAILRKGQIVFYDMLTGDGAVVDGVEVPGHLLRTRGEELGKEV